ncbi:MAG: M23 family metallopeptidase [Myxococcota bacterium]|nr:M23 family metallopeptidase [Myxococcota bacterium]
MESERLSLIVVSDETSPIRRMDLRRSTVRRAVWAAGVVALLLLAALVDWVMVRLEHPELGRLRQVTAEQQARIDSFDDTVAEVEATLSRVREFERKVRTIANLPGSAAAGGAGVVEVGPAGDGDLDGQGGEAVEAVPTGAGTLPPSSRAPGKARSSDDQDELLSLLRQEVKRLGHVADQRQLSLQELVTQLEDKHQRLASSPAVWPTQGWLTSRFGTRISPFTGKRQFHAGIDVAGERGTPVIATANGKVVFSGSKGPLGKTVIIDHGHGIRTHYGHNHELFVKRGEKVERGQKIATLGNSGRSTGPHLHYTVEVRGKAVNPLDYIFD